MNREDKQELIRLADLYIDSRLSDEDGKRLDRWLQKDETARQVFSDYLHDHAALYWSHVGEDTRQVVPPIDAVKPNLWRIVGLVACVAVVCAMILNYRQNDDSIVLNDSFILLNRGILPKFFGQKGNC